MAKKKSTQASLALIHCLNRGMSMAQAKAYLRQAADMRPANPPQKQAQTPPAKPDSEVIDDDAASKPEWLG